MVWTTLAHHIDQAFLHEAYRRTRKDGAVGVDGQTAHEYGQDLEANLQSLLERFRSGTYKAPPVRRTYIPKGDGNECRGIGIPAFEDKVLQRAVSMILEAVYEQDFLDCSYGFRPHRSAHGALDSIWKNLTGMGGGWVLDVDVRKYFDTIDHGHLRGFLDKRVRDGVIRKMIDKWLKAGVLEDGQVTHPEAGTPQGGVISPLLANIYLHEVVDQWFVSDVQPRLNGPSFLVRYADDLVMAFSSEEDARRVLEVLPKRFGKYGLAIHPDKTRLVRFKRPPQKGHGKGGDDGPGSFDFLGFTHYWGKSRKGPFIVKRKTAKSRFARSLKAISDWCRRNRHLPVAEQQEQLASKLSGHYQYYGITGNSRALSLLRNEVSKAWHKWLSRRSQRSHIDWDQFNILKKRFPLPPARAVHSVCGRGHKQQSFSYA